MPSWLLQRVQGVRPDVTIINLALAHASETWLREQFARLKIDVDVAGFPRERPAFLSALTRALVGEARPVYVALTVPARHRSSIERDLKLCGLTAIDPQHLKWSRLARHLAATSDDRHFADHVTARLESLR